MSEQYYIEGIVDTLTVRECPEFTIIPDSSLLIPVRAEKRALFIGKVGQATDGKPASVDAKLVPCSKTANDKYVVWFSCANADASIKPELLLEAKNNRNRVRITIGSGEIRVREYVGTSNIDAIAVLSMEIL